MLSLQLLVLMVKLRANSFCDARVKSTEEGGNHEKNWRYTFWMWRT